MVFFFVTGLQLRVGVGVVGVDVVLKRFENVNCFYLGQSHVLGI
jgi:hypothetical protein